MDAAATIMSVVPRTMVSVVTCLLAFLAVGCGTTRKASSPEGVSGVLHSYLRAQASGDGSTACALLTPTAQNQLTGLVVSQSKGLITQKPSCQDAVGLVKTFAGARLLSALARARVEQVEITGTRATAEVLDGTAFPPQRVALEEVAGKWKIAGVPSLGG